MSIFIVDENFFIFQVVDGLVVDIIDGVGVVQGVWRRLLSKMGLHWESDSLQTGIEFSPAASVWRGCNYIGKLLGGGTMSRHSPHRGNEMGRMERGDQLLLRGGILAAGSTLRSWSHSFITWERSSALSPCWCCPWRGCQTLNSN